MDLNKEPLSVAFSKHTQGLKQAGLVLDNALATGSHGLPDSEIGAFVKCRSQATLLGLIEHGPMWYFVSLSILTSVGPQHKFIKQYLLPRKNVVSMGIAAVATLGITTMNRHTRSSACYTNIMCTDTPIGARMREAYGQMAPNSDFYKAMHYVSLSRFGSPNITDEERKIRLGRVAPFAPRIIPDGEPVPQLNSQTIAEIMDRPLPPGTILPPPPAAAALPNVPSASFAAQRGPHAPITAFPAPYTGTHPPSVPSYSTGDATGMSGSAVSIGSTGASPLSSMPQFQRHGGTSAEPQYGSNFHADAHTDYSSDAYTDRSTGDGTSTTSTTTTRPSRGLFGVLFGRPGPAAATKSPYAPDPYDPLPVWSSDTTHGGAAAAAAAKSAASAAFPSSSSTAHSGLKTERAEGDGIHTRPHAEKGGISLEVQRRLHEKQEMLALRAQLAGRTQPRDLPVTANYPQLSSHTHDTGSGDEIFVTMPVTPVPGHWSASDAEATPTSPSAAASTDHKARSSLRERARGVYSLREAPEGSDEGHAERRVERVLREGEKRVPSWEERRRLREERHRMRDRGKERDVAHHAAERREHVRMY